MLLALVSPVLAGLLVNEVVYDPSGSDAGLEWIELCNDGGATIDLTGWQIESAGASWTESYTFASGSLAPGEYLIVGAGSATHTATFSPNLPNGGDAVDGIRVKDGTGTVIDTVLYDDTNTNALTEDDGSTPTAGAPAATSGKSIGRFPDCRDTDSSSGDFALYTTDKVSPGGANVDPEDPPDDTGDTGDTGTPAEADCTGSAGVVVNELVYATGAEFVELYNAGSADVVLDGWQLSFGTRPTSTSEVTLPAGITLAPGGFFVVGGPDATFKDVEMDLEDIGNGSNTDGLLLLCNGETVDTLVYSDPNEDGWTDDSGAVATSLAEKPGSSESIARVADGVDTDQCGADFIADVPSPGYSNTATPVGDADCENGEGIKINELVYTTGAEWIELYNAGSEPVALDAWVLQFGTSSYNKEAEIPDDTTLAPGEWLVLGATGAATKDIELSLDFGNATDADAVRITCNGVGVDTLVYGSPNESGWADDTGATATSLAPKHGEGESIARTSDGHDTDQSGLDFVLSTAPSPGAENPYVAPPVCESGADNVVKINEFVYDPEGTDGGNEWIELVNTGDTAVRLDAWVIEGAGSKWDDEFTFPSGVELAPGAFLVVGGDGVGEADHVADGLSIDNASSGAGGLRLVDCEAAVIDSVLYGGDLEDPITGDGGSIEVVPETGEGASLGRYPDGEDSDGAADWFPYGEPTPGAANTDPGATDGPDDKGPRGCGGNSPPKPGEGGCSTVLPFGGMEVGLAALALLRRRRK